MFCNTLRAQPKAILSQTFLWKTKMKYQNVCCNIQVNLRHMGRKSHERYLIRKQFDHFSIQENARISFPTKAHGSQASLKLQEEVT